MKDHILASPAFAGDRPPLWAAFDADWYRTHYGLKLRKELEDSPEGTELDLSDEALERHWKEKGARAGLSPNRFFDEGWYLQQNPDVREGIRLGIFDSGFLHYCESGFRSRSPHWLFSEENYFSCNPDLSPHVLASQGFCNGYDHYLAIGDQEHRTSHPFFDPEVFRSASLAERQHYDFSIGDFVQFISTSAAGRRRTSWYFDPEWYLERYPAVVDALKDNRFLSPLHHYLTNDNPTAYDPNPWFSEAFYARHNPDVAGTVEAGHFRNGYAHFLRFGIRENRCPNEGVDLPAFSSQPGVQRLLRQRKVADIFALWVQSRGSLTEETVQDATEDQYLRLDLQRAQSLIPSMVRAPLDFRPVGAPDVTVILPASNQFRETLATLAALHANNDGNLQVILVDAGSTDETAQIEKFVRGVHILRPPHRTSRAEQIGLALAVAKAEIVLLLCAGIQPFPRSLKIALEAFGDPDVHAVGGQSLGLDGKVREAGSVVWRNGSFTAFGKGLRANEPEIAFRRPVDAFTLGQLFCRRISLEQHGCLEPNCIGSEVDMLAICLALRQAGGKILYDPDIIDRAPPVAALAAEFRLRNEVWLKHTFANILSRQRLPESSIMRACVADGTSRILFLCERLPYSALGTPYLRHRDMMLGLSRLGYQITVFPLDGSLHDCVATALDFPPNVELMDDFDLSELQGFLRERSGCFDFVWISSARTLQRAASVLLSCQQDLPELGMIVDVHGCVSTEQHNRRRVGAVDDRDRLLDDLEIETDQAWLAQALVVGTPEEKADLALLGHNNVRVIGAPPIALTQSPSFRERSGILFVLPVHENGDAIHDGLHWFVHEILPKLDRTLPADATVLVAGHRAGEVDLSAYARYRRLEAIPEESNLETLYRSRRILVEPSRVLASIPREVMDAASAGLPAVLSETLLKSLGWTDGKNCLSGSFCDADEFARAITRLYLDMDLWNTISQGARQWISDDAGHSGFYEGLRGVLFLASGAEPLPAPSSAPLRAPRQIRTTKTFAPAPIRLQPRATHFAETAEAVSASEKDVDGNAPTKALTPRVGVQLP